MAQEKTDMQKLLWIADSWVSASGETTSYEEWKVINDDLFEGGSKTIKEGKVIFGGRLGMYKYFDMHMVIAEALNVVRESII